MPAIGGRQDVRVRVWVVEDVPVLLEDLCFHLRQAGYDVAGFRDGPAMRRDLAAGAPDIVVLDVGLPGESGIQVAEMLRAAHPRVGIVMLTGRSMLQDRLAGRGAGADEYLCKPVQLDELMLVLQNLARRMLPEAPAAAWVLDVPALLLTSPQGVAVELTAAETHFVRALAGAPSRHLPRRQLVEAMGFVWETYDERRLEAIVSRLRHKLAAQIDLDRNPLRSRRGEGYAFLEPLRLG